MYERVLETANFIQEKVTYRPKIAIILGSGLGDLAERVTDVQEIDYKDIPHFPVSTVVGHESKLVFGMLEGKEVVLMQGRFHFYEGYSMKEVTYPVYVMKLLGIETLIVTNACGGINTDFAPGDLMFINDYINFLGTNPLIGANDERFGTRFPDMSEAYSKELLAIAKDVAEERNIGYKEGVYMAFPGPCYETAAEIRAFRVMGVDAVGMSTVPETQVANYLGIKVLGISCITNMATGIQTVKHSHARVVEVAKRAGDSMCGIVLGVLAKI